MRSIILIAVLSIAVGQVRGQDSTIVWQKTLVGQASGAQAGFQNWAEGGVNTLALSFGADGSAEREEGRWNQKHELKLAFGLVKQDTLDFRKAEDLIRLRSKLVYTGDHFFATFKPTIAAGARSQMAPGYNFDSNPIAGNTRVPPVKVADFFSPAVFSQTLGLTYDPNSWFTERVGLSMKETVVSIERLRSLYSLDPDQSVRVETGIEAFTEIDRELVTNVRYKSSLGLFASFTTLDSPDVLWENLVALKVNSWLGVNIEWAVLLDKDVSQDVQFKEVFSIGVSYIFL
jgi:hypothetical protein